MVIKYQGTQREPWEPTMNDRPHANDNALDQTEQDAFTVSDEALEQAAGGTIWAPMLTGVATICVREPIAAIRRTGSSSTK
jgi:hypothetical protein